MRIVTRQQAIAHRLHVNHLVDRLPAGSHEQAAYVGLQDTAPRDALLALHARMQDCTPTDWQHPAVLQTYSPRAAVYVLPARDFGIFTLGRLPLDPAAVRRIDALADRVCERLAGQERRGAGIEGLREACASGRIAVRWDTTSLYAREVPRPAIDVHEARLELCRRHVRYFGPTSPKAFAWWSGLSPADARAVWDQLAGELLEVDFDGAPGWVLRTEEHHVAPPRGVRLLAAPDLRLFGRDSGARFIAPGLRRLTPVADSFHPNGVLADGRIVGAWGRKGGRVDVILAEHLTPEQYEALQAEVTTMPVPDPELRVQVVGGQSGACHSPVPAVRTSRTTPAAARSTKAKPPRRRPSS